MNGILMLVISLISLTAAYLIYGRWLSKKWGVDTSRKTPAHEFYDGTDYIPAKRGVVFGHEFASIAGAGPINGPIIAAMFGWVPVLLWILVGGIFIGAVQDFASIFASVRNKGRSIGYVIELYIGKTGKRLFLLFVWLFSILVIAAFADIVAGTWGGFSPDGAKIAANASVASTSILFIFAAVALGFLIRKNRGGLLSTLAAVALLAASIALGLLLPVFLSKTLWLYIVFAYVFLASVAPVWMLLQPRDYLNSFLLIAMIICALAGVFISNPTVNIAPFNGFVVGGNYLFPILFVTVACGAVSGFHSLVASGTASKQIDNERDMLPVSFGAMLLECLLAVLSLIAVGSLSVGGKMPEGTPPVIFATAVSGFLSSGLGFDEDVVYTLITLSISAFALTSLDSVARVGRLSFQELFTEDTEFSDLRLIKLLTNKYFATGVTLFFGWLLALRGYQSIWPLFGSANQLLAALSLTACAVFLKKTKRSGAMLYIPLAFMLLATFTALILNILEIVKKLPVSFTAAADGFQLILAVLLAALGVSVAVSGFKKIREKQD